MGSTTLLFSATRSSPDVYLELWPAFHVAVSIDVVCTRVVSYFASTSSSRQIHHCSSRRSCSTAPKDDFYYENVATCAAASCFYLGRVQLRKDQRLQRQQVSTLAPTIPAAIDATICDGGQNLISTTINTSIWGRGQTRYPSAKHGLQSSTHSRESEAVGSIFESSLKPHGSQSVSSGEAD